MIRQYQPEKRLHKLTVPLGSKLADRTIAQVSFGKQHQIRVVQIGRKKGYRDQFLDARADLTIKAGDVLFIDERGEDAQTLAKTHALTIQMATEDEIEQLLGRGHQLPLS